MLDLRGLRRRIALCIACLAGGVSPIAGPSPSHPRSHMQLARSQVALTLGRRPRGRRAAAPLRCSAPPHSSQRIRIPPANPVSACLPCFHPKTHLDHRKIRRARHGYTLLRILSRLHAACLTACL